MNPLRALLIAFLLIALPMQGLAAYTPAMVCADAHAAHTDGHEHPATTEAAQDHHHPGSTDPAEQTGGHSCCHHVVSAAAPLLIAGIPATPHVLAPRVSLLTTLFIPELPQRPPRA